MTDRSGLQPLMTKKVSRESEVAIFTPEQFRKLLADGISDATDRLFFAAYLATGARGREFSRFTGSPEWYSVTQKSIHMPEFKLERRKQTFDRWIKLSDWGVKMIGKMLYVLPTMPEKVYTHVDVGEAVKDGDGNTTGRGRTEIVIRHKWYNEDQIYHRLRYYTRRAGMDETYVGKKTMRITWASWLAATMPDKSQLIILSQGDSYKTFLHHYLASPFPREQREEIIPFVKGWG